MVARLILANERPRGRLRGRSYASGGIGRDVGAGLRRKLLFSVHHEQRAPTTPENMVVEHQRVLASPPKRIFYNSRILPDELPRLAAGRSLERLGNRHPLLLKCIFELLTRDLVSQVEVDGVLYVERPGFDHTLAHPVLIGVYPGEVLGVAKERGA
jgi:hypothetical protein